MFLYLFGVSSGGMGLCCWRWVLFFILFYFSISAEEETQSTTTYVMNIAGVLKFSWL
jgi:hypothetical protein